MMTRFSFSAAIALFLVACGGSKSAPPPHPEEVPIDTESSKREAKRPDPDKGTDVTAGPVAPSSPAAESSEPAAAVTAPSIGKSDGKGAGKGSSKGTATASAASAPPPKSGGPVSKAECDQLMDKYIEVVVTGEGGPLKGMSGKEFDSARAMIKSTVAQDPNFVGFKNACLKDLTRSQYTCAMKSRAKEEFQTCIK